MIILLRLITINFMFKILNSNLNIYTKYEKLNIDDIRSLVSFIISPRANKLKKLYLGVRSSPFSLFNLLPHFYIYNIYNIIYLRFDTKGKPIDW